MSVPTSTNLPRSGLTSGDDDGLTDFDGAAEILRTWRAGLTPDPDLGMPEAGISGAFPNPIAPPSGCTFHPRCPQATARCSREAPASVAFADGFATCHNAGPALALAG